MESHFCVKRWLRCLAYITWVNSPCKAGVRVLIWQIKLTLKTSRQKYTRNSRAQSHQRSGLPETKSHVLPANSRSQDKNSNNSLMLSSPALWKQSRNTSKLNSYIRHVDWLRSRTLSPTMRVKIVAFEVFMPISALDRPVPPPANSATFPRSKLLPATDQDVTPENSFSKQAPRAPPSWKPQQEVKFIFSQWEKKKCS